MAMAQTVFLCCCLLFSGIAFVTSKAITEENDKSDLSVNLRLGDSDGVALVGDEPSLGVVDKIVHELGVDDKPIHDIIDKLGLGEVLAIETREKIPDIILGHSVDDLITKALASKIQSRPVDYSKLAECTTNDTNARNGISDPNKRWYDVPNVGPVAPVVIDPLYTVDEKNIILAGIKLIEDKTCMRYFVFDDEDQLTGLDYIFIQREDGGCYSDSIGRAGKGKQIVNLKPTDQEGRTCMVAAITAHELLHATGFQHQQNTPGRDNFVTIKFENIQDGKEHNFEECPSPKCTDFDEPYDYNSVMHYGKTAFSKNGELTIITPNGEAIGQRRIISDIDAIKVNKMHKCET